MGLTDIKVSTLDDKAISEMKEICLRDLSNIKKSGVPKEKVRKYKKSFVDNNWDKV